MKTLLIAGWLCIYALALIGWFKYFSHGNFLVFWIGLALLWFIFVTVTLSVL